MYGDAPLHVWIRDIPSIHLIITVPNNNRIAPLFSTYATPCAYYQYPIIPLDALKTWYPGGPEEGQKGA